MQVMKMRQVAQQGGFDVHCHVGFSAMQPLVGKNMQQVVNQHFTKDSRSAVLGWISRGPFWDGSDSSSHHVTGRFEANSVDVTGCAPAEASHRTHHGADCGLISLIPSEWSRTSILVDWRNRGHGIEDKQITINNWLEPSELKEALQDQRPLGTWEDLETESCSRFLQLDFADECFQELSQVPFSSTLAKKILERFSKLNDFAKERNSLGKLTKLGDQLYRDHFVGARAWFSDSSDREKSMMKDELTFSGPDGQPTLYPWHGKINHVGNPIRFHFEWPIKTNKKVYIAYIGPKRTKR